MHWDGKLLPALTGRDKVDRIAILVSGKDTPTPSQSSQLLGVPAVSSRTGKAQATVVSDTLVVWQLDSRVVEFNFDTTAANTGS